MTALEVPRQLVGVPNCLCDFDGTFGLEIEAFYAWRVAQGPRLAVHAVNNFRVELQSEGEATATWYEDKLGAEVIRTPQPDGSTRIALNLSGQKVFIAKAAPGKAADAPLCLTCGVKMRPAGSCYVCESCGSTSGCS